MLRAIWSIRSEKFNPYLTMQQSIYQLILQHFAEKYPKLKDSAALELFARYYAADTMETVRWWLDNHEKFPAEYPYRIIMTCLKKGMLHMLTV